jgi:hypothetical protein
MKPADIELRQLNQQQAAYVLGVTTYWMKDRVQEIPRTPEGQYDAQQVVKWYVTREVARSLVEAGAADDPKVRKMNADAALAEMKVLKMAGELVPIHTIEPYMTECAAIIKRLGEQVQKQLGDVAYELYAEAVEEIERVGNRLIDAAISEQDGEAPETASEA